MWKALFETLEQGQAYKLPAPVQFCFPSLSFQDVYQQKSMFNHQMSRIYNSFNPNSFSSRLLFKDPIDQSLQMSKLAEIKRLTSYISSTSIRQSGNCFTGHPFQSSSENSRTPRSQYLDLEFVGYKGFLCKRCLIAYPLPLYYDKFNKKIQNP